MGFWKTLGYGVLMLIGWLLVAFEYFLVTPMKASTAVLQLEDSNALYAIGEKAATSNVSTVIFVTGVTLILIGIYKLLTTGKGKNNETNE